MALPSACSRILIPLKNCGLTGRQCIKPFKYSVSEFSTLRRTLSVNSLTKTCRSSLLNQSFVRSEIPCARFSLLRSHGAREQRSYYKLYNNRTNFNSRTNKRWNSGKTDAEKAAEEAAHQAKMMRYSFIAFGATFTVVSTALVCDWGAPKTDSDGNILEDAYSTYSIIPQYIMRAYSEAMSFTKAIQEPSREKLLPEPLTEPYIQPPYTLCLEMTGVLVHPEWSYETGWRFKKRPGVTFFLQQVGPPLFELVIYTHESGLTAYPIIDNLDPQGYVMYRLFKDATRYDDGVHKKELGQLNREMKRVILVDWNEKAFDKHKSNTLKIAKWKGNDDDRTLVDLAIFLRTIAESGVDDVRAVLEYYSNFEDPLGAFRENQRKLAEQEYQAAVVEQSKAAPAWSAFKRR